MGDREVFTGHVPISGGPKNNMDNIDKDIKSLYSNAALSYGAYLSYGFVDIYLL